MLKNENSILYIENGVENIVKVNFFNKNNFLRDKLGKRNGFDYYYMWRNPELELVYFKNFTFDSNSVTFNGDLKDRLVILDNCSFKGKTIFFNYCDVEVINPKFLSDDKVKISVNHVSDFNIILSDNYLGELDFEVDNCGRFSLDGKVRFCDLMVFADECYLSNFMNYKSFVVNAKKKIKLSNCDIRFENFNQSGLIKTGELILEDTSIIDGYKDDLGDIFSLAFSSLTGKNYAVKIKYDLAIHNDVYSKTSDDEYLVLFSDKDLSDGNIVMARRDFISVLKGIRQAMSSNIGIEVRKKKDSYAEKLSLQKKRVNDERLILKKIQEKVSSDVDSYKCELLNQSVGKVMVLGRKK